MPTTAPDTPIDIDIAVIGGGVAGLWLLDRLRTTGYQAALLTQAPLGSEQTLASQGMIHGGVKYTLAGTLSGASEAIADMPKHWRACLNGEGDVDLRETRVLSDHFYMWSTSTLGKLTGFFASRALRGRVEKVAANQRPPLFQNPAFKGSLYKLVDMVLDVPSLLANLKRNNAEQIFALPASHQWRKNGTRAELVLDDGTVVRARQFVFTAGRGNQALLNSLDISQPEQQLRPLKQLVVRHRHPYAFYGHCLGADKTPRLTISSHPSHDGSLVWYLGGSLAEEGANLSDDELIARGRNELKQLFPWLDFSDAQFSTLFIERAEPKQPGLVRPDQAFAEPANGLDNVIVAWPTKLTLTPNMAQQVLAQLDGPMNTNAGLAQLAQRLNTPDVAALPWEQQ
ncbi:NAD(P)/FAD-dependent oxidoreductase [Gilvimarinus xylanilyticus]|uniref:FAD-dependent oxidoreductase n=1 Tax=Gilvimarinus xylanilyticus TaxID=2944139 RepID=A0A9X2I533_9GAMM|nr:FAD-dependent oxidoreductase [Gilvimarinus xylanilyticus]MCP8900788.1 FAD-dependent oxidoreductase [Gilvimarinus xylanilyticus]